jgi:hypothetical protein
MLRACTNKVLPQREARREEVGFGGGYGAVRARLRSSRLFLAMFAWMKRRPTIQETANIVGSRTARRITLIYESSSYQGATIAHFGATANLYKRAERRCQGNLAYCNPMFFLAFFHLLLRNGLVLGMVLLRVAQRLAPRGMPGPPRAYAARSGTASYREVGRAP